MKIAYTLGTQRFFNLRHLINAASVDGKDIHHFNFTIKIGKGKARGSFLPTKKHLERVENRIMTAGMALFETGRSREKKEEARVCHSHGGAARRLSSERRRRTAVPSCTLSEGNFGVAFTVNIEPHSK